MILTTFWGALRLGFSTRMGWAASSSSFVRAAVKTLLRDTVSARPVRFARGTRWIARAAGFFDAASSADGLSAQRMLFGRPRRAAKLSPARWAPRRRGPKKVVRIKNYRPPKCRLDPDFALSEIVYIVPLSSALLSSKCVFTMLLAKSTALFARNVRFYHFLLIFD